MGIIILDMGTEALSARTSLGDILFGQTRQRVFALLFGHPEERFYQRRVIQAVGLGSGTVQRDLERLSRAGVLIRSVEGHQVYFQANRQCAIFAELRGIVRKTFGVAQTLQEALASITRHIRMAFVFGSVAAGMETSMSDIDILVVGDNLSLAHVIPAIAEAQRELGREINPSVYPTGEFCRKLAEGQHFISNVVAGRKIFLIGDEHELTRLAQIRVAEGAQNKPARNRRTIHRSRS
jgi:predicted nucleotidyltransferase